MSSDKTPTAAHATGALFAAAAICGGFHQVALLGRMLGMSFFTSFLVGVLWFVVVLVPPSLLLVSGIRRILPGAGRGATTIVVTGPVLAWMVVGLGPWAVPYVLPAFAISTVLAMIDRSSNAIALAGALPIAGIFAVLAVLHLTVPGPPWDWIALESLAASCAGASAFLAARDLRRQVRRAPGHS